LSASPERGEPSAADGTDASEFVRLRDLLAEALDADEAARARLLAEVAAADPRLGAELAALVRADEGPSPLDRGFDGVALALAETVASAELHEPRTPASGSRPARWRLGFALAAFVLLAFVGLAVARLRSGESRGGAAGARPEGEDRARRSAALREAGLRAAEEGAPERGLGSLAEAAALDEAAFRSAPESSAARLRYVESLLWLGAQRTAAGHAGQAVGPLALAAETLSVGPDTADAAYLRLRALVAIERSLAELELGHLERALEHQQRAVEIQRSSELSADGRLEHALALRDLGDLHRRLAERPASPLADRTARHRAAHGAYVEAMAAARAAEATGARDGALSEIAAVLRSLTERLAAVDRELDGAGT
jgi:tetratricopeptide (TPR) repeat protein